VAASTKLHWKRFTSAEFARIQRFQFDFLILKGGWGEGKAGSYSDIKKDTRRYIHAVFKKSRFPSFPCWLCFSRSSAAPDLLRDNFDQGGYEMKPRTRRTLFGVILWLSIIMSILPFGLPAFAATLLSDNFESYTSFPSGGWTNASSTCTWSIVTDGTKVVSQTSTSSSNYYMVNGQSTWGDYTYSAKVKVSNTSTRAGLLGRYQDTNNYYALYLYNGRVMLDRRFNSSTTTLQQANFVADTTVFYTLKIELNGSSIKGYINDTLYMNTTDSNIAEGKIGFYGHNGAAKYDDVLVSDSSTIVVPAAPTNLTAASGDAQVSLSWTASSGATGYNVKRSTTSGGGYITVTNGIISANYNDTGLTNGTTYYYVVTAVNSAGESGNSNQASATPQASTSNYDAGLNMPFQYPAPVTGQTLNVLDYGATPNNPADDDFAAFQNAINAANGCTFRTVRTTSKQESFN
jgi:hypothetical protein